MRVHGVLYHMDPEGRAVLDRIEGVGQGYRIQDVVVASGSEQIEAFTYVVQENYIDPAMQPFHWYKRFVLEGARQNGFPPHYIAGIDRIASRPDPNRERARRNHAIGAL